MVKSKTRIYKLWKDMRKRCNNPNASNYHRYGGRGIYVCEEWDHNFEAFKEWALDNGYDENATKKYQQLDRIDNNGPYSHWNCRFATAKEQANNRRERRYRNVLQVSDVGLVINYWPSARSAAKTLGICRTTMARAIKSGDMIKGCIWRYE